MKLPGRTEAEEQAKQQKLDELLGGFLDYPMLAERSLGSHWKTKTPAERQEFIDLLTRLIHKNYQKHLRGTLSFKIQYKAEAPLPEGVLVTTVARSLTNKRAEPVTIEYAVRPAGTDWKVFDITTDGVSMVRNYRTQFHKILVKDGWGELIGRMKKRLAENKDDVV